MSITAYKEHIIGSYNLSEVKYPFKKALVSICIYVFLYASVSAQMLKDTSTFNLVKRGVDYIYNFQFDEAYNVYEQLKFTYPDHPIPYLFRGLITYWRYFPLIPSSPALPSFEKDMFICIERCEKKRLTSEEPEYIMADIAARGLLLLYYADNDLSMEVVSIAPKTYQLVRRSFDLTHTYADFYFITGLYNYYREAYPEAHPVYKPLSVLFPRGDKAKGLKELKIAANYAIFLKSEAYSFLTGIFISFENNYQTAYHYSKALFEQYPRNNQFLSVYVKNLLLIKQYDKAENILEQNRNPETLYFQVQKSIFQGILSEKKYKDPKQAEIFYKTGIKNAASIGDFANEYVAYCYFGLSRIMKARGELKLSKSYHKKAMDMAAYKNVNFND
ncbi:MAG: hypothetical protein JW973_17935 [Bacteroidales bacterium]|nr:hypothetical protein [Bacteroidales bacterium]